MQIIFPFLPYALKNINQNILNWANLYVLEKVNNVIHMINWNKNFIYLGIWKIVNVSLNLVFVAVVL